MSLHRREFLSLIASTSAVAMRPSPANDSCLPAVDWLMAPA